ncbi:class I SAM-dependent methyltransferase [Brockia lithotrophica]|uniref:Methyltransferase family protein n=1 Tax=Brockia lithotrophica TaxID=933949 RepID=A0A660L4H5_9BACL|nr:class I SAM-dependent methyltransferase [Brockia lithotrophica]RKQ88847.1 methyltransferase family protein [Brockia lithotrophica]
MDPFEREARRIRLAYEEYARDLTYAGKWSLDNPGNRAIVEERESLLRQMLREHGFWPLTPFRILDVGCGTGTTLARVAEWGARPENLVGIDLLPERIAQARKRHPDIAFYVGNAAEAPFPPESFDLVFVFTVFSSIFDDRLAHAVARKIWHVLASGGAVVWYDLRYPNPFNRKVRPITRSKIRELFPEAHADLRPATLIPPVARHFPALYPYLARIRPLKGHYLGILRKR